MRTILLNSDSPAGAGTPSGPSTEPKADSPPAPAAPIAEPPKTAATALKGEVTEDSLKLQEELTETKRLLKLRETDVSEWQREHQRLKASIEQPTPVPVKKKEKPFRLGRFNLG